MKQAPSNCFPAYLLKDLCKEVLRKCYLAVLTSSPQAEAVETFLQHLQLREANNQVEHCFKKKAKTHAVITVNRNLVSSDGN